MKMERISFGVRMEKTLLRQVDSFASKEDITRSNAIETLTAKALRYTPISNRPPISKQESQNQESGAAAARWGMQTGPKIARKFNGTQIKKNTNIFFINGRSTAIKTAKPNTNIVGVYNTVRERVETIWGAFQLESGPFEIFEVSVDDWVSLAREPSKNNRNYGKLTLLRKQDFQNIGHKIGLCDLADL
jgi:hypothetical protein